MLAQSHAFQSKIMSLWSIAISLKSTDARYSLEATAKARDKVNSDTAASNPAASRSQPYRDATT